MALSLSKGLLYPALKVGASALISAERLDAAEWVNNRLGKQGRSRAKKNSKKEQTFLFLPFIVKIKDRL